MSAAKNLKDDAINAYIPFAIKKYKDVTIQDLHKAFEDSIGGAIQDRSRADLENHFITREINGQNNIRHLAPWEIDILENRSKHRSRIIQYNATQEQRRRGR
jgi:hypothetical protein